MSDDLPRVLDALVDGVVVVDGAGRVEQPECRGEPILERRPRRSRDGRSSGGRRRRLREGGRAAVLATGASCVEHEVRVPRRFQGDLLVDAAVAPLATRRASPTAPSSGCATCTLGAALREVERERAGVAALGQIAAGIAHEVRNPLGGHPRRRRAAGRSAPRANATAPPPS